jgi:putative membrane protein
MTTDVASEPRFQIRATADSHFAWVRTRLALERTATSWVRTAVSLIGFGFTIVQFFERMSGMEGVAPALRPNAPRYLGLSLIGTGVIALVITAYQYRMMVRYMWDAYKPLAGDGAEAPHRTPVFAITIGMIFVGVFAFASVVIRAL